MFWQYVQNIVTCQKKHKTFVCNVCVQKMILCVFGVVNDISVDPAGLFAPSAWKEGDGRISMCRHTLM